MRRPRNVAPLLLLALAPLAGCSSSGGAPVTPPGTTPPASDAGAPPVSSDAGQVDASTPVDAGPPLPLAPSSPWPKFRGDARQDGVGQVHAHTTGGAKWAYQTGKGIFSSPVVAADGTVYIGSADRNFYALNAADGSVAWKTLCGELIDSAALLDDRGHVYFGAGDGKVRALDAKTGAPLWTATADDPSVNGAQINWFEGNVGIGADGTLYAPNDNYFVYAIDRDSGAAKWKFKMPDQTWSLPAVDTMNGGTLYVGNNNMVSLLGANTYSILPDGGQNWSASIAGTIAASPMITPDGNVVLGAFDGYVHAYDHDGNQKWSFATRDHVYSSTALLPDGSIVAASADGSVYDLDAATGTAKWQFDTPEPIRGSPSVDADGNIYFGDGDGRLYVLNPNGTLRWSLLLIDADRNDLNSSPALGADAIYLGGESGQLFSVPYDYCLRADAGADPACSTTDAAGLRARGVAHVDHVDVGSQLPPPGDHRSHAPHHAHARRSTRRRGDAGRHGLDEGRGDDRSTVEPVGCRVGRREVPHHRPAAGVCSRRGRDGLVQREPAVPREQDPLGAEALRRDWAGAPRSSRSSRR